MKTYVISFVFILTFNLLNFAQTQPGFGLNLIISDNVDIPRTITFGIDPTATDGIDPTLGESELPPFPPPGGFEARFYLPQDNFLGTSSSWTDIRQAAFPFTGQKEYRIRYQPGSGTSIVISWNFPPNISGKLQDVVLGTLIDVNMTGQSSFEVLNPTGFDRLKMLINYNNVISGIADEFYNPNEFVLYQNFPNPFNPGTTISFFLPTDSYVKVKIYDVLGMEIASIYDGFHNAGLYSKYFDGSGLSSGTYMLKLETNNSVLIKKMTILK